MSLIDFIGFHPTYKLKKKVEKIEDNTEDKDQKRIADPLKNAKAIIKHYGTHNRLK